MRGQSVEDNKQEAHAQEEDEEEEEAYAASRIGAASAAHMEDEAGASAYSDYKRGKRFKNLLKFFSAAQVSRVGSGMGGR